MKKSVAYTIISILVVIVIALIVLFFTRTPDVTANEKIDYLNSIISEKDIEIHRLNFTMDEKNVEIKLLEAGIESSKMKNERLEKIATELQTNYDSAIKELEELRNKNNNGSD